MLLNLRARTMHQYQMHPQTGEQIKIVGKLDEFTVGNNLPAEGNDKSLPPKRIDVRRDRAEPGNELSRDCGQNVVT
jgi:hypothetical protein